MPPAPCGAALCRAAAAGAAAGAAALPPPATAAGPAAAPVPCRRSSNPWQPLSRNDQRPSVCCSSAGSPWQASSCQGGGSGTSSSLYLPGQRWGLSRGRCDAVTHSSNATSSTSDSSSSSSSSAGLSSSLATPTGWHPLDAPAIWKGTEEQAVFRQATPYPLTPSWKVILLSDGSVTRHLQLMTNQRVEVECLEMRSIGHERAGLPPATAQIPGPLVQRQVMLHIPDPHSKAYVYATSWWNADTVDQYLRCACCGSSLLSAPVGSRQRVCLGEGSALPCRSPTRTCPPAAPGAPTPLYAPLLA